MKKDQLKEFVKAYDEYADAIYRFCFFRVYSQTLAEELVQETYLKAWRYLVRGRKIDNMRPFLYQIARNLIIDVYRKNKNRIKRDESLEKLLEIKGNAAEPSYDGKSKVEKEILFNESIELMSKLPENYREVLMMRYVENLKPKEIAQALKTSPQNVSARINRGIKKLKLFI